jgi:hypothetical protein
MNCKGCWAEKEERARGGPPSLRNLCRYYANSPCCECLVKVLCGQLCESYHDWTGTFTNWSEGMEDEV